MKLPRHLFYEAIRISLPLAILAAGVVAFAAISSRREPPMQVAQTESLPVVETVPAEIYSDGLNFDVDGIVVPFREISLSAEVGGRITHKSDECRAGRYVTEGTVLVQIDRRTYELEIQRLAEEIKQAEVSISELDIELRNIESLISLSEAEAAIHSRELQRAASLYAKNASTESTVDDARRADLTAQNNLTTLQNQVRSLQARRPRLVSARDLAQIRRDQAQLEFERSTVRAPISGVIVSESVEQDSYVQPGSALLVIEDTSAAEVQCNLRMEELNWLWQQAPRASAEVGSSDAGTPRWDYQLPQTPVTITYRLQGHEYQWSGLLSRYQGIGLDQVTRTVPCRVLVENPRQVSSNVVANQQYGIGPRALVRGMYVRVTVHARPQRPFLKVPQQAIQPGNIVWSVDDGKLRMISLRNPHLLDEMALVSQTDSNLKPGDPIVVSPLSVAIEGMPVDSRQPIKTAAQESSL